MRNTNPLLTTLYIIRSIGTWRPTAAWLRDHYEISDRTLKRHLTEAQNLGAELRPVKLNDGRYHWECANWETLEYSGRLNRWISLEEERKLT